MSDDEDDPFERLGDSVGDREGDPFEKFEDVDAGEESDENTSGADEPDRRGHADPLTEREEPTEEPRYDAHDVTPADHADEVPTDDDGWSDEGERAAGADSEGVVEMEEPEIDTGDEDPFGDVGGRAGDPFDGDVFEQMDVGEMDPDEVWEAISDAEEAGSVSQKAERIYADVSKHRFCEQCEFFSDPPDIACSHEGTEILEFLDQETVRVVDCPVVAERKELEKHD